MGNKITTTLALLIIFAAPTQLLAASGQPPFVSGAPVPVIIQNSPQPSTPAPVTSDIDNPGRIPYQKVAFNSCIGLSVCRLFLPQIPGGQRLVVQHVAVAAAVSQASYFEVGMVLGPGPSDTQAVVAFFSPMSPFVEGNPQQVAGDQAVQFYVDSSNDAVFLAEAQTDGLISGASRFIEGVQVTITGYLLDCSVNQCAAIAP